jgi:hypothetical protein
VARRLRETAQQMIDGPLPRPSKLEGNEKSMRSQ